MPFTFFHPAAVVPLLRVRVLVPAALVIGAMSPDFEYFPRGARTPGTVLGVRSS
ncbi:MAG: DUF4184 family protein, partial [Propionibacterium sp.]|nr:DUF4184 family protein [Propionibacterium sp.]